MAQLYAVHCRGSPGVEVLRPPSLEGLDTRAGRRRHCVPFRLDLHRHNIRYRVLIRENSLGRRFLPRTGTVSPRVL